MQVLVNVEYDGDGDDKDDGINIGADEFADDIPVKFFQVTSWTKPT